MYTCAPKDMFKTVLRNSITIVQTGNNLQVHQQKNELINSRMVIKDIKIFLKGTNSDKCNNLEKNLRYMKWKERI